MSKKIERLQQKADVASTRLEEEKQKLAEKQRKARTRALIEHGGLVAKAGLDAWPKERMLGAMLAAASTTDAAKLRAWEQRGAAVLNGAKARVPATAKFDAEIDRTASTALKDIGFKYNPLRKEWEGRVVAADAADLVQKLGGEFKLLP